MYSFTSDNGLSIQYNGKNVLTGLAPWVQATPTRPSWSQDATVHSGKIYLALQSVNENEATFEDEDKVARMTLSLKQQDGEFALFVEGAYRPHGSKYGSHIHDEKGVGIDFDIPGTKRYIDAFMNCHFWQRPFIGKKIKDIRPRTQAMMIDKGMEKVYLSTTCHNAYKSEMFPAGKIVSVVAQSNTVLDDINDCVLIGGVDKDAYSLPEKVIGFGMKIMEKAGKLRKDKRYPEEFEYLGWCSWDAFHMDVTHDDLLKKCEEFKQKDIPVRWMIIDDMWGDVDCIDRKTMHQRELNDWEADPVRFPKGLKGAVSDIKSKYGMKVGIWHPANGYWSGINPNGALAKRHGDLLEYTLEGRVWRSTPQLMHSFDRKKAEKYYDLQHKFYKDCGIDFTKVDNQGSCKDFAYRKGDVNTTITNLHLAIEKASKKYYGGALINCMGMPIENFWNRTYSNVNRFSGDFQPENRKWFVQHLLQCAYNSLTQGTVYTGDWDMWWSDDAQARKNAVLRAMSGGPIYMSDELNRSIKEVIMPTVFTDGRILRLPNPAIPTKDCMFDDSEHNGRVFKVFNKYKGNGIVAAFNLDENESAVTGVISPEDAGLKRGEYVAYNWFTGEATLINKGERLEVTLNNYDDFRLIIFVPVKEGKAVIGLAEKYMTPLTVKKVKGGIEALDDGTLKIWENGEVKHVLVKKGEFVSV